MPRDPRRPQAQGHSLIVTILFRIEKSNVVPRGIAVCVRDGIIRWVKPAQHLNNATINSMQEGDVLNLSIEDYDEINAKLKATGEGIPIDDEPEHQQR